MSPPDDRGGTSSEFGLALDTGIRVIGWRTRELMKNEFSTHGIVSVADPSEAVREVCARYVG